MKVTTRGGFLVMAACISACSDSNSPASAGGPDFDRALGVGEYQVRVTGDVQRSFETTGAVYGELGTPPFSGWDRATFSMMGNPDALNGAAFDLCTVPTAPATYAFDAMTPFAGCPSDPTLAMGGFIVQLGAPQADELDCYPNGSGNKNFHGSLTITAVTGSDIQGEATGTGTCSRHPHSEVGPMRSAAVSVRVRFRASRGTP
jgi:hypothetical protein